jgi:hypothetical protein
VGEFVRTRLEGGMGGLTPLDVIRGWPVPMMLAVFHREPKVKAQTSRADPGALAPGEAVITSAELARIIARRKAAANGPTTPKHSRPDSPT